MFFSILFTVREDETLVADIAPDPPDASTEQQENAIEITLENFSSENVSSKSYQKCDSNM